MPTLVYDAHGVCSDARMEQEYDLYSLSMVDGPLAMDVKSERKLMQVYLERQGGTHDRAQQGSAPDSSNWEAVARLLSRKHDRINPQHALTLLPGQV